MNPAHFETEADQCIQDEECQRANPVTPPKLRPNLMHPADNRFCQQQKERRQITRSPLLSALAAHARETNSILNTAITSRRIEREISSVQLRVRLFRPP
jgi:hypothetical protein